MTRHLLLPQAAPPPSRRTTHLAGGPGRLHLWAAVGLAMLAGCGDDAPAERTIGGLRLIGQQVLPRRMEYASTVVGGLSGADYDAANDRYLLLSDDRTTTDSPNPPRMYTAKLTFDANSFTAVTFESTFPMKQPGGAVYPKVPDPAVADPESVRIDPVSGNYVWVSEGDRALTAVPPRVIDPFLRELTPDGSHVRSYEVPAMFKMSATDAGPRGNAVFEGLTFTPDTKALAVITEGPLFQDGPAPSVAAGARSRLTMFDRASGSAIAQYAYPISAVQRDPVPAGSFTVNGPSEILAVSNTRFLVLERSFSVGVIGNQLRLYEIDVSKATNVLDVASLTAATAPVTPVSKRLVLNFETLKDELGGIANLECLTFGPTLANGHASLVIVADDNFPTADSLTDRNQFLVFEVLP
jgi:hypothetical protein